MPYLGPLLQKRNLNPRRASLEHKNTLPGVGRWFPTESVRRRERLASRMKISEIHDTRFQCFVFDITTIPHHSYRVLHFRIQNAPDEHKKAPVIQVLNSLHSLHGLQGIQSFSRWETLLLLRNHLPCCTPENQFNSPFSTQIFALAQITPAAVLFPRATKGPPSILFKSRYSSPPSSLQSTSSSSSFTHPEFNNQVPIPTSD